MAGLNHISSIYSSTATTFEGRLGLFPGTFDPVHLGHVEIARIARDRLNLNAVIFIPNFAPPHKELVNHATAFDRYIMVQLAVLDEEGFYVSDFEIRQGKVNYTIDTIQHFSMVYPKCELALLVGGDSLRQMHTWKLVEEYSHYVKVVGISRAGENLDEGELLIPKDLIETLEIIEGIDMRQSSTEIKKRLSCRSDLTGFIDPLVEKYILKYGLYECMGEIAYGTE